MSTAKMTLISFNKFFAMNNDDLFVNLSLPEGIDKDILTNNILLKGADFEVMYADPYFMQEAIGMWSGKWQRTFEKWVDALAIEYSPLENYDRKEDWSDTLNKGVKTLARRDNGNERTFDNYKTVDETEVSAFDSSTYQPSEKTTSTPSGKISDKFGEGSSGSETENSKTVRDGRIHGNIGVTTSQQMLQAELDIAQWNLYEHITDLFLEEFVIPIYS